MASETAHVHLRILGRQHSFEVPFVAGPTTLSQALRTVRTLMARTLEAIAQSGQAASCRSGCAACCRHFVVLTEPEARALGALVATLPEADRARLRARFERALEQAEAAGILGPSGSRALLAAEAEDEEALLSDVARRYFELGIACPFLEDESCAIYEERPLACREYAVSSEPRFCATFAHPEARLLPLPRITRAFGRAAQTLGNKREDGVPLLLLFEWNEAQGDQLDREHEGVDILRATLRELGRVEERETG